MKTSHRARLGRAAATISLAVSAVALTAAPALATNIACQPINGAPSLQAISSNSLRTYYYHSCNGNPSAAGVQSMSASVGYRDESAGVTYLATYNIAPQATAAYNATWTYSVPHEGWYTPVNTLVLTGNFAYGSVPGCGRKDATRVVCRWTGTAKYLFSGSAAAPPVFDASSSDVGGVPGVDLIDV